MSLSLPVDPPSARSLTAVVPHLLAALDGRESWFRPVRSAVLLVVDGLGRTNLSARAGHARFLAQRMTKKDAARSVFPATTASALTSLLTGEHPGRHGIVGYRVRIPGTDDAPDQLKGWETHGLDPLTWQRSTPLFATADRPCFVVSKGRYEGTGFTRAIQRGARFVAAATVPERLEVAAALARRHPGALIYAYVPELDTIAHARGWESEAWTAALEGVDAAARTLDDALDDEDGAVLTADHGMVDVPHHRQVLFGGADGLAEDVRVVAGEPRMLHLYAEEGRAEAVRERWGASEDARAWVFTRDEAIEAGVFGPVVDDAVRARIGDVLVAARSAIAYYDIREKDTKPRNMIGQHGSLTDEERIVPLIRLGGFATA